MSTISSQLHALYELTSIHDADDLAAWWKEHRVAYALFALDRLGVTPAEILEHLTSEPRQ